MTGKLTLCEDLLIITSEYNKFDRSNRRLDLLALDRNGFLVVIELKLDACRTFADLQALRYAAFCSTMTMEDAVTELASYKKIMIEEATTIITCFLECEELPELGNRPRIILVAGSMDDQELTSSVLWLRTFGIDISCLELTPYRIPPKNEVILVPRVLIPLPEAKEYLVSVARKEGEEARRQLESSAFLPLWSALASEFNNLQPRFPSNSNPRTSWLTIPTGRRQIHYEWAVRKRQRRIDVAIHFELNRPEENYRLLEIIQGIEEDIKDGVSHEFVAEKWGERWAHAKFHLTYSGDNPEVGLAQEAANLMKLLMDRTWPKLENDRLGG